MSETSNPIDPATELLSAPTAKRRRAAKGRRWSASSSVEWRSAQGAVIAKTRAAQPVPAGAVAAVVRYRLDAKSRKVTFRIGAGDPDGALPHDPKSLAAAVESFLHKLALAYSEDWPADASHRPTPPAPLLAEQQRDGRVGPADQPGGTGVDSPGQSHQLVSAAEQHDEWGANATGHSQPLIGLTGTGHDPVVRDVVGLIEWRKRQSRTSLKKRGGDRIKGSTQGNYDGALNFFAELARYRAGDPRLQYFGLEPGASWRIDDPAAPVTQADLLGVLDARRHTDLRDRAWNERRIAAWRKKVQAARTAGGPVPEMPQLREEVASARTMQAFAQQVKKLFVAAAAHDRIGYQPWTAVVDDHVPSPGGTSYTERVLPNRDQISELVVGAAAFTKPSRDKNGSHVELSGERYAAMIWLAGREGPRPEETIAIRDSWVLLDREDPRIVLYGSEVYVPSIDGRPRERVHGPLKGRSEGAVRVIRPHAADRDEFIEVLSKHRASFVDTSGEDDPYFFTTHRGYAIDPSNFNEDWWHPIRDAVFGKTGRLSNFPFRRLRAAAITDWLVNRRFSTFAAADKAGNSQAIIEKHYKGVLEAREQTAQAATPVATPSPDSPKLDVSAMSAEELESTIECLSATLRSLRTG